MSTIYVSNDINCPCNIKKCTRETIESCCGCPEWFKWKNDIEQTDKRNPKKAYVGMRAIALGGINMETSQKNSISTDSVFDRLVKVLDTNCGYVDEEPAEKVAKRIMRAGLLREVKPEKWEFLFSSIDGTPRYRCPVCKELELRETKFCPNCGAVMQKDEGDK